MQCFIAYFTNATLNPQFAKDCEFWKERIKPGGPYFFEKFNYEGVDGVLASQKTMYPDGSYDIKPPSRKNLGKSRELKSSDPTKKIVYFAPKELPDQLSLARRGIQSSCDVTLSTGITLSIPFAAATPRSLDFTENTILFDKSVNEMTKLIFKLQELSKTDAGKSIPVSDWIRLVGLAIKENYRVTDDLLLDLQWVQDTDLDKLILAISGQHPKS